MIPIFPNFKYLELADREEIGALTTDFPPYSDINYTSLWSYNTVEDIKVCFLNGNLVFIIRDYLEQTKHFSFFGKIKAADTLEKLLAYAKQQHIIPEIKFVPEFVIKALPNDIYTIVEDRDHFDYILSLKKTHELKGNQFEPKRRLVKKFYTSYPHCRVQQIDIASEETQHMILSLFSQLRESNKETEIEYRALQRIFTVESASFLSIGVFDQQVLIGYLIAEIIHNKNAIGHFTKGNTMYKGIYEMLYQNTARELLQRDCKYFNIEQDLGINGLRSSKLSWRPVSFLKKYTITKT